MEVSTRRMGITHEQGTARQHGALLFCRINGGIRVHYHGESVRWVIRSRTKRTRRMAA